MLETDGIDYYEALQVSPTAAPDLIRRVYRLLAQRFHPDNAETGDAGRFRQVHEAYTVLADPVLRAKFDLNYQQVRQGRIKLVSDSVRIDGDLEYEQAVRLTVLEVL